MYYPPVRQPETLNNRTITVYGNYKLSIQPNVAEIRIGVEERAVELHNAQQESARRIQQVIQAVVNMGVAQTNIQTVDYHIYPLYDFIDGSQQFKGYQVTHMLSIAIENINQIGIIIDTAIQHGANRVSNIKFTVSNIEGYYQQALQMAIENAVMKAQTIANAMRVTLHPIPVQIVEQTTKTPPFPHQIYTETGVVAGVATPIEPGQLEIEANIVVKFQY
ncbi:SIMPL domain-containing protein [Bacillus sp. B15-48]|uniref:SIMPL domain-containing protein n=1 Tax=Bacillus sp. B15-48 TaxID=1548601 RepID=UPI00193EDECB|nr:SIMPL domain-containing protein [Bacillus sp. B15-48]MBM4762855.1 DUF541 domain-containing protein [Bacillus sp. B15-48]